MKPLTAFSTRAKNRTESAAMNGGMEIGLTVLLFVLLGLAIDNWLGTDPMFVIVLFLFGTIGSGLRYYFMYTADMERLEAERAASRSAHRPHRGNRQTPPAITSGSTASASKGTVVGAAATAAHSADPDTQPETPTSEARKVSA